MQPINRRQFLKSAAVAPAALALPGLAAATPATAATPADAPADAPRLARQAPELEAATEKALDQLQARLAKRLKNMTPDEELRMSMINLSMTPPLDDMTQWCLASLGSGGLPGLILSPTVPFVKWMCEQFLLLTSVDGGIKTGPAQVAEVHDFALGMARRGMGISLDCVGDASLSARSAQNYYDFYLSLIKGLAQAPDLDEAYFSLKLSALVHDLPAAVNPADPQAARAKRDEIDERLGGLIKAAAQAAPKRVFLRIDMEEYVYKNLTIAAYRRAVEENREHAVGPDGFVRMGLVLQAYLRDTANDISQFADWAARLGLRMPLRLVKGAYEAYEKDLAREMGLPMSPVWNYKSSTDANYEALTEYLVRRTDAFQTVFATHNLRTQAHAIAAADAAGWKPPRPEIQMLYGMGDPIKDVVVDAGYAMRVYVPTGSLMRGAQYAGRRFHELACGDNALARELRGDFTVLDGGPPAFVGEQDVADGRRTLALVGQEV